MKNLSFILLFCATIVSAQISVAGKVNALIPTNSATWDNIKNAVADKGKNTAGFNVGVSLKVSTPSKFFVMPELYYTNFKSEIGVTTGLTTEKLEAKSSRLDLPVLLGVNVVGDLLGIYAGPVASYNISKNNTFNAYKEDIKNNFTLGYQVGAQAEVSSLIITARYEAPFGKDGRSFINKITGIEEIRYDSRPSFFIVGLGYKF